MPQLPGRLLVDVAGNSAGPKAWTRMPAECGWWQVVNDYPAGAVDVFLRADGHDGSVRIERVTGQNSGTLHPGPGGDIDIGLCDVTPGSPNRTCWILVSPP